MVKKNKHNKKRNTAFVYEALIREATVAIVKQDTQRKEKVFSIIKKHFNSESLLYKDLECYRSLYENTVSSEDIANKILIEVKAQKKLIDPDSLFKKQTDLIHDINKELTSETFNNFVPNYRCLATIQQILSVKSSPRSKVMLEGDIIKNMIVVSEIRKDMPTIDALTYRKFASKFNEKYDSDLISEQKELLTYYVTSFSDNSLQLKIYLNNEIKRLKSKMQEAITIPFIKEDEEMVKKAEIVVNRLNSFSKETVNEHVLLTILKSQALVQEIYNADNN